MWAVRTNQPWDGNVEGLQPAHPAGLLAAQSLADRALQCPFTLLHHCPASILSPTPQPLPRAPSSLPVRPFLGSR